jgi:hypothetical protein
MRFEEGMAVEAVRERIAYLKGLGEGTDVGFSGSQGQMLVGILEVLQELVGILDQTREELFELGHYVEELDEALWDLELKEGAGEELLPDEDRHAPAVEWEVDCPGCGESVHCVEEDDVVELLCPVCGEVLWSAETMLTDDEAEPELYRPEAPEHND